MVTQQADGAVMTAKEPVIIKKYANRRLYNTASSTYVTLETLAEMVRDDIDFIVYDAKSGEDLTRGVLTQIIVEQEGKGVNLLPISFLRQIISLYGDNMQFFVPNYLEEAMKHFSASQQVLQENFQKTFGNTLGQTPLGQMFQHLQQNMQKQGFGASLSPNTAQQNLAQGMQQGMQQGLQVFEQMMKFFSPFGASSEQERNATLSALKQKIAAMEKGEA